METEFDQWMGVEEYFELEEANPDKRYEYIDGYVYMMSGGTTNHNRISLNIATILSRLLSGSSCETFGSDMRVRVSEERYVYPDVTVTCDRPDTGTKNIIETPCVVVEVLSPSTEARDRIQKFHSYLACPSIEEYLMVDWGTMRIEVYRKEGKKWVYDAFEADDEVELTSLGISFPVADA
jgi:Uma2 family endonuclease